MITAISQFANQSFGLPIENNAKTVTLKWKPTEKVNLNWVPTKSDYSKQQPRA